MASPQQSVAAQQLTDRVAMGQPPAQAAASTLRVLEANTPEGPGASPGAESIHPLALTLTAGAVAAVLVLTLAWITDLGTAVTGGVIAAPFLALGMWPMLVVLPHRKRERLRARRAVALASDQAR